MVKMNGHANGSRGDKLRILLDDDMNGVTITDAGVYIVYMGDRPKSDISVSALHISMLQNVVG
ncbi:hypothetical protein D5086_020599, partial [Populus alba]